MSVNWEEKCKELEIEKDGIVTTLEKFHEIYIKLESDYESEKFNNQQKLLELEQKLENERQLSTRSKTEYELLTRRAIGAENAYGLKIQELDLKFKQKEAECFELTKGRDILQKNIELLRKKVLSESNKESARKLENSLEMANKEIAQLRQIIFDNQNEYDRAQKMNEKAWEEMNDELQKNIHHNGVLQKTIQELQIYLRQHKSALLGSEKEELNQKVISLENTIREMQKREDESTALIQLQKESLDKWNAEVISYQDQITQNCKKMVLDFADQSEVESGRMLRLCELDFQEKIENLENEIDALREENRELLLDLDTYKKEMTELRRKLLGAQIENSESILIIDKLKEEISQSNGGNKSIFLNNFLKSPEPRLTYTMSSPRRLPPTSIKITNNNNNNNNNNSLDYSSTDTPYLNSTNYSNRSTTLADQAKDIRISVNLAHPKQQPNNNERKSTTIGSNSNESNQSNHTITPKFVVRDDYAQPRLVCTGLDNILIEDDENYEDDEDKNNKNNNNNNNNKKSEIKANKIGRSNKKPVENAPIVIEKEKEIKEKQQPVQQQKKKKVIDEKDLSLDEILARKKQKEIEQAELRKLKSLQSNNHNNNNYHNNQHYDIEEDVTPENHHHVLKKRKVVLRAEEPPKYYGNGRVFDDCRAHNKKREQCMLNYETDDGLPICFEFSPCHNQKCTRAQAEELFNNGQISNEQFDCMMKHPYRGF